MVCQRNFINCHGQPASPCHSSGWKQADLPGILVDWATSQCWSSLQHSGIWPPPSKPVQLLRVLAYRQDILLFSCFPPTYQATQEVAGLIFSGPWTLFLPQLRRSECLCERGPSVFPSLKSELALGPIKQQPALSHLCLHLRSTTVPLVGPHASRSPL